MNDIPRLVVAIMGATATGKTDIAVRLAEQFSAEIVSMDSRQIYGGLEIGTAKPGKDILARIPHHLINILEPSETTSAGRHLRLVDRAIADIARRDKLPFLVGGTGLYFRAFFDGLIDLAVDDEALESVRLVLESRSTEDLYDELRDVDPARAEKLSPNDRMRISRAMEIYRLTGRTHTEHLAKQHAARRTAERPSVKIVLSMPRDVLRDRIAERTVEMFSSGWVDEVRALLDRGVDAKQPAMNSLGYDTIANAIESGGDPLKIQDQVITLTQQYAKRQETFFRGISGAHWVDVTESGALDKVKRLIEEGCPV